MGSATGETEPTGSDRGLALACAVAALFVFLAEQAPLDQGRRELLVEVLLVLALLRFR